MYFRDPEKELPKADEPVLVRLMYGLYEIAYYSDDYKKWYADLDNEVSYNPEYVVGWMPISELDSIEIK